MTSASHHDEYHIASPLHLPETGIDPGYMLEQADCTDYALMFMD